MLASTKLNIPEYCKINIRFYVSKLFSEHQKLSVHLIKGICDYYKYSLSHYSVLFKLQRHSKTENV